MSSRKGNSKSGGHRRERHISVRSVRREEPDVRKLATAIISLAMAQAEAEAQAEREADSQPATKPDKDQAGD